jgi:hypothetical protein
LKQIRKRLTYANVMSSLAVFLVLGGATALAAGHLGKNTVGTKQLKKNAVTTAKIKKNAVNAAKLGAGSVTGEKLAAGAVSGDKLADNSVNNGKLADGAVSTSKLADNSVSNGKLADNSVNNGKLADGAVSASKLADNSVTTGKIAAGAVTAEKLTQSERSEAFRVNETSGTIGPLPNLASTPTTVATLNLPAGGSYAVTGETEFINTDIAGPTDHYTQCVLNDDGTEIGTQTDTYAAAGLFPSGGVTVVGISNGGTVNLACRSDNNTKTFAFQRQIVAIRAGAVSG